MHEEAGAARAESADGTRRSKVATKDWMHFLLTAMVATTLDCGSAWNCFESAFARSQTATVVERLPSEGSAPSATPRLRVTTSSVAPSSVVVSLRIISGRPGEPATDEPSSKCTFRAQAFKNLVADVGTMGVFSPVLFLGADSCTGALLTGVMQERAAVLPLPGGQTSGPTSADCGLSFGCLVRALGTRRQAAAWSIASLPLFGLQTTTLSFLKTSRFSDDSVTLDIKTIRNVVTIMPQAAAQMKAQGVSADQIAAMQRRANRAAATGLAGTCRFKVAALKDLLRRWYLEAFSTDDWKRAESCRGTMFATLSKGS